MTFGNDLDDSQLTLDKMVIYKNFLFVKIKSDNENKLISNNMLNNLILNHLTNYTKNFLQKVFFLQKNTYFAQKSRLFEPKVLKLPKIVYFWKIWTMFWEGAYNPGDRIKSSMSERQI